MRGGFGELQASSSRILWFRARDPA
jgi:hypothetical protein